METLKFKDVNWENDVIKNTVAKLLDNGFNVYIYETSRPTVDATYGKGGNFAYLSLNYGGIAISTRHKPNGVCGSGYGVTTDSDDTFTCVENPTIAQLERGFMVAPFWAKQVDLKHIRKYTDIQQIINDARPLKYKEVKY